MRFLRILAVMVTGLWIGSCGDDDAGASVNDNVSWILGCAVGPGCGSPQEHRQVPKHRFKVSCKKSGSAIDITITDPGYKGDQANLMLDPPRPFGEVHIANGDAQANRCNITVRDATSFGFAPEVYTGACAGSSTSPTCVLQGQFNVMGWVWVGTLSCAELQKSNSGAATRWSLGSADGGPMQISVDNC